MILQLGLQILNGDRPRLFKGSDQYFRDFVDIDDVIQANIKACQAKKNGVYNVGTGEAKSFIDIVDLLQEIIGVNVEIKVIQKKKRCQV